jgi:hypothetical protein
MKPHVLSLCLFACTAWAFDIDDVLDQLDSSLTVSAFHDNFRARLSGTVDLEFYNFQQPAPGLIDSDIDNLFNPRLTLFLDAQLGSQFYFFAQARLDRVRSERPRRRRSRRVRASSYTMAGWPLHIPSWQIRDCGRQLGPPTLAVGQSVYYRAVGL